MISVVSPFYNEETILAKALDRMVGNLQHLTEAWEIVIVNDGSTDDSLQVAKAKAQQEPRIKIVSYEKNRGRGHALKTGIDSAQGEIIVTTEIDCSWGDDVVRSLTDALRADKTLDIVIASTNLPGGGYRNVPLARVAVSRIGNYFLGLTVSQRITMFTGMTRGYRAASIRHLPISESGKEFHLDVIAKAIALGLKVGEIPAILTWQHDKLARADAPKRKSSSKLKKIIGTHLLFGLGGRPFRYLFVFSMTALFLSLLFLGWAVWNFSEGRVSVFLLILSVSGFILSVLLGGIGVLALQQNTILREIWIARQEASELLQSGSHSLLLDEEKQSRKSKVLPF